MQMPYMIGLSMKEANMVLKYLDIKCEIKGNGFVTSQSIPEFEVLTPDSILSLEFTTYVPPPEPTILPEETAEAPPE